MIRINGKDIDLERALPLTLGDLRRLRDQGIDLLRGTKDLEDRDAEADKKGNRPIDNYKVLTVMEYLICKAGGDAISKSDFDQVPIGDLPEWVGELEKIMPRLTAGGQSPSS